MKYITLENILGETISHIRYSFEKEYDLQIFHSYIKLENDIIFSLPTYDDSLVYLLNGNNKNHFGKEYNEGEEIEEYLKKKIIGHKIEDIYFCYYMREIDDDKLSVLKLSNGIYFTEINYRPVGISVGLEIYTEKEFQHFQKEYTKNKDCQIKSYLRDVKL